MEKTGHVSISRMSFSFQQSLIPSFAPLWVFCLLSFSLAPLVKAYALADKMPSANEVNEVGESKIEDDSDPEDHFSPVGEVANYDLDKNKERTSSIVKSGNGKLAVVEFLPISIKEGERYVVEWNVDLKVQLAGNKKASGKLKIPSEFFTPAFREELRIMKEYQTPDFNIRHLGQENTRTIQGGEYQGCDKIFIYDIKSNSQGKVSSSEDSLNELFQVLGKEMKLQTGDDATMMGDIEDLTIDALICDHIPVLGAAKLDIKGKTSGMRVKIGLDYHN